MTLLVLEGLARIAMTWNKPEIAMMHAKAAIDTDPNCGHAYSVLSSIFAKRGEIDCALEYIKSAIEREPSCSENHFQHGLLLLLDKDHGHLSHLQQDQQSLQRLDAGDDTFLNTAIPRECLKPWLTCLRISTGHSNALYHLGLYYLQCDVAKAEKCFFKAIDVDPLNFRAVRTLWRWLIKNDRQNAADDLIKRVSSHSGSENVSWIWFCKGITNLRLGETDGAVAAFQTSLRYHASDPKLWQLLAEAYMQRGSLMAAVKALEQCISLDASCLYALHLKGLALIRLGEEQEAIVTFESILEKQPHFYPAVQGLVTALFSIARASFRNRRAELCADAISRALSLLKVPLQRMHEYHCLWKLCGDLYLLAAKLPEPIRENIRPILFQIQPENSNTTTVLSLLQCASAAFAHGLQIYPSSQSYFDLALAQWQVFEVTKKLQSLDTATRLCKEALIIDPSSVDVWDLFGIVSLARKVCCIL